MSRLKFDEADHSYWHGDDRLMSVTEVLTRSGVAKPFDGPSNPWWFERGNLVHDALAHRAQTGDDPEDIDTRILDRYERGAALLGEIGFEPIAVEYMHGCPALGVAGRFDALGRSDLGLVMFDWKATSSTPHAHVQLGGYWLLLKSAARAGLVEITDTELAAIRLAVVPLGSGRVARPDWVDGPEAVRGFESALWVAKWRRAHGIS